MNVRAPVPTSLVAISRIPAERIRFYERADHTVFEELRCGVLFVVAFWSGPSRIAFARLTEVLAQQDPDGLLQFVVVDTDGVPEIYQLPEFLGKMHRAGETAWVKDGQVLRTSGLGFHPECFVPYTAELLVECQR